MSSEKKNHFPPTLCTWIEGRLDDGTIGRDAINRHVMESYELPLRIYYLGTSWRTLGEPEDIINGFMADRLERPNFFTQWKSSGKRLRHWLINALHFYLKEQWRRDRRHDAMSIDRGTSEDTDHSAFEPSMNDRDVDRAWAKSLVASAIRDAQQSCVADGYEDHWRLFMRHHLDGINYRQCADEFDVDAKRCAVMVRTAATRFRTAIQARLLQDGVPEDELPDEVAGLQEALR
jgi:DNA-directed RNA polymerase specialized sigma24 family protein